MLSCELCCHAEVCLGQSELPASRERERARPGLPGPRAQILPPKLQKHVHKLFVSGPAVHSTYYLKVSHGGSPVTTDTLLYGGSELRP